MTLILMMAAALLLFPSTEGLIGAALISAIIIGIIIHKKAQ